MQVFKTFFRIAKRHITSAVIYSIIFVSICVAMTKSAPKENEVNFTASSIRICVFDNDNTAASKALIKYLGKYHELTTDLKDVDDSFLQDSLYYTKFQYILTINKGYEDGILNSDAKNVVSHSTLLNTMSTVYATQQIDRYISAVRMYLAGGFSLDEALDKSETLYDLKDYITEEDFNGNTEESNDAFYYFQYFPYMILSILIMCMTPILISFNKLDVKRRINCSSLKSTSFSMQLFSASIIYSIGAWLMFMVACMIIFTPAAFFTKTCLLAVANSFVFLLFSLTVTLLLSNYNLKEESSLSMVSNILGLGMAFLCGIFVPQWDLGEKVLSIARFLPAYWYIKNNNMLAGFSSEAMSYNTYFTCIGIQLMFSVAILVLFLVTGRRKKCE